MSAIHIDCLLETTVRTGATDLFLLPERPPMLRVGGVLRGLETRPLTADDVEQCAHAVASDEVRQKLGTSGAAQWAFGVGTGARFRARCLRHQTGLELTLRCHPLPPRPLDKLGLPLIVRARCRRPRGLFLVVGPAGGGKTTLLAALLDYLNQQVGDRRIVTLEPVIEFLHAPARCLVIQQETGLHDANGAAALRQAVSGRGDVLLLGDFTDLAVRRAALDLACQDCLVLAEWAERGTVPALRRWLDEVPATAREQLRGDLAAGLLAILHYELCPRAGTGGLVAAYELLVTTQEIVDSIRDDKLERIPGAIETGRKYGLCLLDDRLWELFQAGSITPEVALERARDPAQLQERIERRLHRDEGDTRPPEFDPVPVRPKSPPPGLTEHKEPEAGDN